MDDLVDALRTTLATAFVLYVKTHSAHWNIEGPSFFQYHTMLQMIYEDIWGSVDGIAEKLRQLDIYVETNMMETASLSVVTVFEGPTLPEDMIAVLRADNETMIEVLSQTIKAAVAVGEQGIINFLAGRYEQHQKWRWFLRVTAKS